MNQKDIGMSDKKKQSLILSVAENSLLKELLTLIENSKQQLLAQANSRLTLLFWTIGNKINNNILQNGRADYGKKIVPILSQKLKAQYGNNFEEKNLRRMLQFASQFPEEQIVVTLSRQFLFGFAIFSPKTAATCCHRIKTREI